MEVARNFDSKLIVTVRYRHGTSTEPRVYWMLSTSYCFPFYSQSGARILRAKKSCSLFRSSVWSGWSAKIASLKEGRSAR